MVKDDSVSQNALGVARQLDQLAAQGGRIMIVVDVDPYGRAWMVEISQVNTVRRYGGRVKPGNNSIDSG